jgi:hypothetical protein
MPLEKETLVVPKAFLHQIMDMLSQIAKPTSGLSSEKVAAVNDVRRQLITFFPMKLKSASRSTDGPSADDIFQKGFRLGAKAVMENFADCADAGISSSEAFRIVLKWLRRPRLTALTKFVEGADPEYWDLEKAFDRGIELGINRYLGFAREDHEDQDLPEN